MKRIFALFIALYIFAGTTVMPVFAEDVEKPAKEEKEKVSIENKVEDRNELEKLILLAKSRFEIPQNYSEFSSEASQNGNGTGWRLRWYSRPAGSTKDGGNLEVMIDNLGNILSYNHYRYSQDREYYRRLPKITKDQAVHFAKKFVYYISPEIADQIDFALSEKNCTIEFNGNYRFNFPSVHNGIPYYDNNISILLNGNNGEIINYNRNWSENIQFPDANGILGKDAVQAAFREKAGLSLKYRRTYGEDTERTYLEYSPEAGNAGIGIDAFSGEQVPVNNQYNPQLDQAYRAHMYRREMEQMGQKPQLSGKEFDEMQQMGNLIGLEAAEKLVRGIEEFGIGEGARLNRYIYTLDPDGNAGKRYQLKLDFMKLVTKEDFGGNIPDEKLKLMIAAGEGGQRMEVTLDPVTSEILAFNSYGRYDVGSQNPMADREVLRKTAEGFLAQYKEDKFTGAKLLESASNNSNMMAKYGMPQGPGGFTYIRMADGIPFEENQLNINMDPGTGKIRSYNENWDRLDFAPTGNVIGLEEAYRVLFEKVGFELKYVKSINAEEKDSKVPEKGMMTEVGVNDSGYSELRLVFAPDANKPLCVDAQKGILINSFNATPYKEPGLYQYSDIMDHSAKEQIQALAEIGIVLNDEDFKPDTPVLQKELFYMISKVRGNYSFMNSTGDLKQKETDGMYRILINEDILNEEEKDPDRQVTREEAARFLLKAMGYKKFAEMKGVFINDFADSGDLNPEYVGYSVLARALNLFDTSNGHFDPKKVLTRAEAAVMIYNYLK